jgi:hypothetical protein
MTNKSPTRAPTSRPGSHDCQKPKSLSVRTSPRQKTKAQKTVRAKMVQLKIEAWLQLEV